MCTPPVESARASLYPMPFPPVKAAIFPRAGEIFLLSFPEVSSMSQSKQPTKKVLMIVNPRAGKSRPLNKTDSGLFGAVCAFCSAGYLVDARQTLHRGHATELAEALAGDYDLIVCCGGDGTLNETVCGLMRRDGPRPLLGYLPAGTTNDFAASLHLPHDFAAAARVAVSGIPTAIDVGRFNDRFFVYVASFGAFTQTSYTVPQSLKNALGHTAYMLEAIRQLPSIQRAYTLSITADGECLDGDYLFGSISNSTSIGGLMKLSPDEVTLDDGKYELLLVRNPKNPFEIQALAGALLTQNYTHEGIVYRHVSHVEFSTQDDLPWTLDGEYAPSVPHGVIDNLHQALTLMA